MTVIVNLPQSVEQAYGAAARTNGVSVDALVAEVGTGQPIVLPRPGASL
jgi:hypothetical protein